VVKLFNKLIQLENAANHFGFCWEEAKQIIAQMHSEILEISAHIETVSQEPNPLLLQEEIGDLLHATFSLCVFLQLNPQETLEKSVNKFERRFNAVKEIATQQGMISLKGRPFSELMQIWGQAKDKVG